MKPRKKLLLTYETYWHIYAADEISRYKVTWGVFIDDLIEIDFWEAYSYGLL